MGCDGGTIPTRDELVKTRKRPEQKDKDSVRLYKWQHCSLTQEPLEKPIVACELGRMYNKEAIIEKLLSQKSEGSSSGESKNTDHIRSLKDVKELELEANPGYKGDGASVGDGGYVDRSLAPWICPVTSIEMNGRFPFVFDWSNGKVISHRAHKMLKDDEASRISEENLVTLNPEEGSHQEDLMATKMAARRARVKAAKKAAKADKRKANANELEEEKSNKKSKSSSSSGKLNVAKNGDGKTKGKAPIAAAASIQNDPTKSEVYKSLFSSHSTAINKPKGNWVTFDPRYN